MKNYIVQLGSGKPGELGTIATEYQILERIGILNPKICFSPFHHLDEDDQGNDWKLFEKYIQPKTKTQIQLIELHKIKDMALLEADWDKADIIVLGSGVCDPYLEFFHRNGLVRIIHSLMQKGKNFIGYSAGSIALGEAYVHVLFFQEILLFYKQFCASHTPEEIKKIETAMLEDLSEDSHEELLKIFQKKTLDTEKLNTRVFHTRQVKGLGLLPMLTILPHFEESEYAMERHLRNACIAYSQYLHFGIPNGVALLHSYENGSRQKTEIVGQNPNGILTTQFFKKEKLVFRSGEEIKW